MSARSILNPPLNTTLQGLANANPVFESVTAPTVYVNSIEPGAGQNFTQIISGEVDTALYGTNGNAFVIGVNSQQSPFPAGGTIVVFETYTNTSTAVNSLSLTTTTTNLGVPLVPYYAYPTITSAIGYTASVPLPAQVAVTNSTLVTIQTFSLSAGVWSIMATYNAPGITTNIFVSTSSTTTTSVIYGGSYVGTVSVADVVVLSAPSTPVYIIGNSVTAGFFTTGGFKFVRIA
jgi:hypothetical protein